MCTRKSRRYVLIDLEAKDFQSPPHSARVVVYRELTAWKWWNSQWKTSLNLMHINLPLLLIGYCRKKVCLLLGPTCNGHECEEVYALGSCIDGYYKRGLWITIIIML